MEPILQLKNFSVHFNTEAGVFRAVDGVDLHIERGETVALVGESGCGKTVCSLGIMRLTRPPGRIANGEVWFGGADLLRMSESEIRKIRGAKVAMVFQEPTLAFDPVYTVGAQIMETFAQHKKLGRREALRKTVELLRMVGIAEPDRRVNNYPHEFSGGMLQRAMLALAICCEPQLLIADEPTTSLDVTVQAQVLELLREMSQKLGTAVILITHNFGIVSRYAKRAYVMYGGNIIETGSVHELYKQPLHPYTGELWDSVFTLDRSRKKRGLKSGGGAAEFSHRGEGCVYSLRCKDSKAECEESQPALVNAGDSHHVRCHRAIGGGKHVVKQ